MTISVTFFMTLFVVFIDKLSTQSPTQLADSSVHSTRVIYHFGELGYNIADSAEAVPS